MVLPESWSQGAHVLARCPVQPSTGPNPDTDPEGRSARSSEKAIFLKHHMVVQDVLLTFWERRTCFAHKHHLVLRLTLDPQGVAACGDGRRTAAAPEINSIIALNQMIFLESSTRCALSSHRPVSAALAQRTIKQQQPGPENSQYRGNCVSANM